MSCSCVPPSNQLLRTRCDCAVLQAHSIAADAMLESPTLRALDDAAPITLRPTPGIRSATAPPPDPAPERQRFLLGRKATQVLTSIARSRRVVSA